MAAGLLGRPGCICVSGRSLPRCGVAGAAGPAAPDAVGLGERISMKEGLLSQCNSKVERVTASGKRECCHVRVQSRRDASKSGRDYPTTLICSGRTSAFGVIYNLFHAKMFTVFA